MLQRRGQDARWACGAPLAPAEASFTIHSTSLPSEMSASAHAALCSPPQQPSARLNLFHLEVDPRGTVPHSLLCQ